jgi:hypothetical protein
VACAPEQAGDRLLVITLAVQKPMSIVLIYCFLISVMEYFDIDLETDRDREIRLHLDKHLDDVQVLSLGRRSGKETAPLPSLPRGGRLSAASGSI